MKYTLRYQLKKAAATLFLGLACMWALAGWMPVSERRLIDITQAVHGATYVIQAPLNEWIIHSQIQEDDPGWHCRTMGNRICGNIDMGVVPQ